jgi:catalase-peroxidase
MRMTWHAAGTYRIADGRGGAGTGAQRFAPLNSWPDNGNLDKARRLLWPVKQKYGRSSAGPTCWCWPATWRWRAWASRPSASPAAARHLGAREGHPLGPEAEWLATSDKPTAATAATARCRAPSAAVQMGLIYVNPQGPDGKPDPVASGRDVRETFARMAMNDEETVALVAGGHTFGKAHGAGARKPRRPRARGREHREQGLGWANSFGSGKGAHTITSGIEGAWKPNPTTWDNGYFEMLFGYEWELVQEPGRRAPVAPKNCRPEHLIPDAHDPSKKHPPMMTTADLSLRFDPAYEKISRRFHADPAAFADAFARAWFKLTHRDMGPKSRYLGKLVPRKT